LEYIQVGIAPRNKYADAGQIRYDTKFADYLRANKSLDSSTIAPGFKDQYDIDPNVDPNVKPLYPDEQKKEETKVVKDLVTGNVWWVVIGIGVSLLVLAIITYFLCCKRQPKPQYVYQTMPGQNRNLSVQQLDGEE
jgi:hypothetical protein